MKKENIKIGDLFELNGNWVIVTDNNRGVEVADVEFDECNEPQAIKGTENYLTDYEIKNLK